MTAPNYQAQAEAIYLARKRAGVWSAGVTAHVEYQKRPIEWIVKYLEVPEHTLRWSLNPGYEAHKWDGDKDPLVKAMQALADWDDAGIESGTGAGKSFLAACAIYWFLACFEDSIVSTVAPKEAQLLKFIWKEVGVLWPRFQRHFPQAQLLTGLIRMKPAESDKEKWAAAAFVCGVAATEDVATKAQGLHAEHLLIITEETPGIHPAIMEALFNTRTDDHNLHLALGNPDHRNDQLHRFCFDEAMKPYPGVVHVRASALDHPNIVTGLRVVPGTLGRKRLEQRIAKYGGIGSRRYLTRIQGISPPESEDALIKLEWCVAAAARYNDPAYRLGGRALGVDVANSEDGDKAAIADWQGACCLEVQDFQCPDASQLGVKVHLIAQTANPPIEDKHIGVDNVGVGASTVNKLHELGLKHIRQIGGGNKAIPKLDEDLLWSTAEEGEDGRLKARGPKVIEAERYDNLRSQVWWRLREDLRQGHIALPHDAELWKDLTTPTYEEMSGKICVESKDAMREQLGRSPNKGDACAYGNFARFRALQPRGAKGSVLPAASKNIDVGLERFMAQHEKRQRAENQRFERQLKARARERKRA